MFEWLEREISEIKTPHFHVLGGPADQKMQDAVRLSILPVSPSYKEFVLKFGSARLYRSARGSYLIRVFGGPVEKILNDGVRIYHIAAHDGASVYVKAEAGSTKLPIFEYELGEEEKVADDFEEWLTASCTRARKSYGKKKWTEILHGPKPFTAEEQEILETRRQIRWRVLGIDANGDHIFEITNAGSRALPVLTVGIQSKDRQLNGAVRLDIGHIGPGQKGILHRSCYKKYKPPTEIEVFALPEPEPEERDYYWEFKSIAKE
jgi:hypothetical protein